MIPDTYPGWLLKRAREMRAHRIIVLVAPDETHEQCAYLLELSNGIVELHVAEDGHAGVEAATLTFSHKQIIDFLGQLAGALSSRRTWTSFPSASHAASPDAHPEAPSPEP